jgi:anti-sigma factor RsiW
MCNNNDIKELLLAYREQMLDQDEFLRVKDHLASCEDCRNELSLLGMMTDESVPDPGESFWSAMPSRVYHAVQNQKAGTSTFKITRLIDLLTMPRAVCASAMTVTALVVTLLVTSPVQKEPEMPNLSEPEYTEVVMPAESVNLAELDHDDLATIDAWAGAELASIARESEQVTLNNQDSDVFDELPELNKREAEQLIKIINYRMKES